MFAVQVEPMSADAQKSTDFVQTRGTAGLTVASYEFDRGVIGVWLMVLPDLQA